MRWDQLQQHGDHRAAPAGLRWSVACLLFLVGSAGPAVATDDELPVSPAAGEETALETTSLATPSSGAGDPSDADHDAAPEAARVTGSLTARTSVREGRGNDSSSIRLGVEWTAGQWAGGFTAQAETPSGTDALWSPGKAVSFALPERWVGWKHAAAHALVTARLGHSFGVRFSEGLTLDAPSFDGLHLAVETPRVRVTTLAGRTQALDPLDYIEEPFGLFPIDDEDLGDDGRLVAARVAVDATPGTTLGASAVQSSVDGGPSAFVGGVDLTASKGIVDVSTELARRHGGGTALYIRTLITPNDVVSLGVERRHYSDFVTPLGHPPAYAGLGGGGVDSEDGWLLHVDFAPTPRFSGSVSFDYGNGADRGLKREVRRDHRVALAFALTERTSLAWGLEFENVAHGYDGVTHSLLATHSFVSGGRLSARLAVDRTTPGHRTSLRLGHRQPFAGGRIALLVDETLRHEAGSLRQSLSLGASFRIKDAATLTLRGTLADGEDESVDLTWYSRF